MIRKMDKAKIAYITGSRADFGRAYYILKRIHENRYFDLNIIATCMHLSPEFGYTIKGIEENFKVTERIDTLLPGDSKGAMAKSFGRGVIKITETLERIKTDLVMVLGDRGEMLAGAIASKHLCIPVAHIGGGHVSGSIDDRIRDSITIFSDLHFVANKKCSERVISLGATPSRTYIVGAPDIEAIVRLDFSKPEEVVRRFYIDQTRPLILVSYHPTVDKFSENEEDMKVLCESILDFKDVQIIATQPNADAGGREMAGILKRYARNSHMRVYAHIPYKDYLGLMNVASAIVGNSSAGIIEAPSFGLPAVNIGSRQKDRDRAENVIDVRCNKEEIVDAIKKALYDEGFAGRIRRDRNPYGDGQTSGYVVEALERHFSIKGEG
jgi:GDP/UDP-N,N'-diacetylbacillosamine 2-epimerase (hydrolysing)